jgi:arylsulfatase A-like enzyme
MEAVFLMLGHKDKFRNRKLNTKLICLIFAYTLTFPSLVFGDEVTSSRPNVLMILVDDLKPALGCYGDPVAHSPHIDALAARGMRFNAAYCNQAVCAPSRYTLMLGSHSTSTGLYGLGSNLRARLPSAVTLPQFFAKHGYHTESLGKVFHIGHGNQGDPESFMVPHWKEKVIEYVDPTSTDGGQLTREEAYFANQQLDRIASLPRGSAFESPDVDDNAYADGRVAQETISRLKAAKHRRDQEGTPFFIAAGFARPHLPFSVPKKYWGLYDPSKLPMPTSHEAPEGSPPVANKRGGEIANYTPVPEDAKATYDEALQRKLIHGYYASVSYVDAQIGKLVEAIDELQLDDNTIIVLWGDHGFHLGDHGIWTKHTNYEQANRIPLVFVAPSDACKPGSTNQPAESADVYPTLCALAGLPAPSGPQPMDGLSLAGVLKDPSVRVRDHAYHAFPKRLLGRAIRTERYRMVQWQSWAGERQESLYELYDYQSDPGETRNLANELPDVLKQHQLILARYPDPVSQTEAKVPEAAPPIAKFNSRPGRWSADRANRWYDTIPWPIGANYIPSSAINQIEMWQDETFDPKTIDRELGWAAEIGFNTMRVFLHDAVWRADPEGFFDRVDQYLTIADRHGIRTMFVIFDGVWHPYPKTGPQPNPTPGLHNSGWVQSPGRDILDDSSKQDELKPYVQALLKRYANDDRVLVWDLFNEPDNPNLSAYGANGQKIELTPEVKEQRATELIEKCFVWAREINPSQPLTVGVWRGDYLRNPTTYQRVSIEHSDVISFHTYDPPNAATPLVEGLSKLGRPMFCTEYMARGNHSTFEGILPILHQHRVAAYNWGFVDGRSQTIYPWDSWQKAYASEPKPWFHDIFRTDGQAYDPKETRLIQTLAIQPPTKQSRPLAIPGPLSPDELKAGLKSHDRALFVHDSWIRDPYITRGVEGVYYLTGTTMNPGEPRAPTDPYNTGLGPRSLVGSVAQVWKSSDLISWDSIPTPYNLRDGVWDEVRPMKFETTPADQWRLWAPELHWTGDRWALVHTSPAPLDAANLSLSSGNEVSGPWSNPMGEAIGKRHDPSMFQDDDGTWWLIWGATKIAKLKPNFSGLEGEAIEIRPAGETSRMGHEGCLIRKINGKYVLFGTGWSTGKMRRGSYNLYYATADQITGPYSERKFVGRFLGHGTPFQDNENRWWCTAFFNANLPPLPSEGIQDRDLSQNAQTINQRGTTLVPLEIKTLDDGTLFIRAKDPAYAMPGPDEAQDFGLRH